jgi:peptidoglycan-N-acetylglucosamine deacetylase
MIARRGPEGMTGIARGCPPHVPPRRSWRRAAKHALLRVASVTYRLDRRAGDAVLLTFDDGPDPEVTPAVLGRLARYGARAVFFVVGDRISRAAGVLGRIRDEGHRIGNHTYSHCYDVNFGKILHEVGLCQEAVEATAGVRPTLFRPPLGRISSGGLYAARRHRLKTLYWSVDEGDWALRSREAALACGERLSRAVGPGDIVLLHDVNPCVLTVLDVLLPVLSGRGLNLDRAAQQL